MSASLLFALSLPGAAQNRAATTVAEIAKREGPGVVLLRAFDDHGKQLRLGSGFLASDARVVTNAHVVAGASSVEITSSDGHLLLTTQFAEALSVRLDIAILPHVSVAATRLELASADPAVGDPVIVIGAPEGLMNTVSDGLLSAIRRVSGQNLLQITAPVSPGSSGGPVLDARGEVIGMIAGTLSEGQNLNFAIEGADLRAMLASPPGHFAFPPNDRLTAADSAQAAITVSQSAAAPTSSLPPPRRINTVFDLLSYAAEMTVRDSAQYGDLAIRFAGCLRADNGTGGAFCVVRVANNDRGGQTRFFIHSASLADATGIAATFAMVAFPASNQTSGLPVNWNIDAGTQTIVLFAFQGVPPGTPLGGTLRIGAQAGWTGASHDAVFQNAILR